MPARGPRVPSVDRAGSPGVRRCLVGAAPPRDVQVEGLVADTHPMDGRVIPLPNGRGLGNADRGIEGGLSEEVSVLSVELRPIDDSAPRLSEEVVERIHERCIRAALVVAGRRGGRLFLAGTSIHPVVDARFRGEGAAARAAHASIEIATAISDSQRSDESHLAACIGIGVGDASMSPVGVRITRGSPARVAELLRQAAEPGWVVLGGEGAADPAVELDAQPGPPLSIDPRLPTVPVWRLPLDTIELDRESD